MIDWKMDGMTTEQQIRFGIGCAFVVATDENWRSWAQSWLSGENRSPESAMAAAQAVSAGVAMGVAEPSASVEAAVNAAWGAAMPRLAANKAELAEYSAKQAWMENPCTSSPCLDTAVIAAWAMTDLGIKVTRIAAEPKTA
jgi:hypothetical protein